MRQASRLCRQLVNAATHSCVLDASCDMTLAAAHQVPRSFPLLSHIGIINAAGAAAGAAAASQALEQQLPGLLQQLNRLSQLALTVTPPLAGALAPLAGLRQLAVLHLAAISPARGWGSALQLLQGCGLQELQLVFADVCDADIAALTALTSLTHVDLHCSRHLTSACVPHLAHLPQLSVLQLAHTGLQLGPAEMLLLGGGCPQLTQLHAEFDLRGMPEPSLGDAEGFMGGAGRQPAANQHIWQQQQQQQQQW
ncbi:hypothetical protein OEZ86_009338 [Tetradesmus obliquus]|nr:hypothetical protein OEZ86_009338 [Tetradesmus obliquus]